MRKQDLNIEIGGLYQLKTLNVRNLMFVTLPLTYNAYSNGYDVSVFERYIRDSSILDKYLNHYNYRTYEYLTNDKHVGVAKEIKWLKYRSSKIELIDEALYHPLIEVYFFKTNETLYVKPKGLDRLKNGNTIKEDMNEDMNKFKSSLLKKIQASK